MILTSESESVKVRLDLNRDTTGKICMATCWIRIDVGAGWLRTFSTYISLWADEGTNAARCGLFTTAPPLGSDSAAQAARLYSTWLETCRSEHETCKRTVCGDQVDEKDGPELPTRVLDLGHPTAQNLVLLESKGLRGEYCALSYCWGPPNTQTFLTTKETLQDRLRDIRLDDLPRTFQDAVQVTRGLGMRYHWIDGLCIIQGDKQDWATEAERMGAVYENASLVIAASGSATTQQGCFVTGTRDLCSINLPYYTQNGHSEGYVHACAHIPGENWFPGDGPLQNRGWALQEAYFARRAIHFMPGGPSWRCRKLDLTERNSCRKLGFKDAWEYVVEDYSKRRLTYKSDRIMAIQRYATEFQRKTGDIYNLGVFLSRLPGQLLWINGEPSDGEDLAGDLLELPSWTWASKGGPKRFLADRISKCVSPMAPVIAHDKFRIDDSGALFAEGCTILCHTSGAPARQDALDTQVDPIKNMFDLVWSCAYPTSFYLMEQSDCLHPRLRGVAYFDEDYQGTVYSFPLMTAVGRNYS
ncbi:hypothetical protein PG993_007028, partial [Apiospora rasikravindrae]